MLNRRRERAKDLRIVFIAIEVHDYLRHAWDQALQNLTLHRREIEKTVEHQEFDLVKPGQGNRGALDLAQHDLERAQLIGIFVGQAVLIQDLRILVVNQRDFTIEIDLRLWFLDFRLWILYPNGLLLTCLDCLLEFRRGFPGALQLANQGRDGVDATLAIGERLDRA